MHRLKLVPVVVVLGLAPGVLTANTFTFETGPSATDTAGELVAAAANITTGAGTVTIDLFNLLTAAQMKSVGQDLSDISFTLDTTTSAGSVFSSTGTFIDVGAGGVVSSATSSLPAPDLIGWVLTNSGGSYELDGLGALATPANTIIGGTAGSFTAYSNANSSITNNGGPHNPFVQGTGVFVLDISGVTADTSVGNVSFSFGTAAGDVISAPEPPTSALLGLDLIGLLSMVAFLRRRKSRKLEPSR